MFLSLLILVTVSLAFTAAYFSIVGIATLFSYHYWGTIIMGAALEGGKIISTSFLYRYWKTINFIRKVFFFIFILLLMILTSIGIFGYLMQGYQEGSANKEITTIKLETNEQELKRTKERLRDIESQIANLPSNSVRGRIALEKTYREEATKLKNRLNELINEQNNLKVNSLQADTHLGPIIYVAKIFNMESSKAATYLVILIVIIFDPLTVLLTISINQVIYEQESSNRSNGRSPTGSERRNYFRRRLGRQVSSTVTPPRTEKDNEAKTQKNEEESKLGVVVKEKEQKIKQKKQRIIPPVEQTSNRTLSRKIIGASGESMIYEDRD